MAAVTETDSRPTRRRKPNYNLPFFQMPEPDDVHVEAQPAPTPAPAGLLP